MPGVRLMVLGPPTLERGGAQARVSLRKALALLTYLAVEDRAFSREYLATLLWPDVGTQDALADLRRTLSVIRKELAADSIATDVDELESLTHSVRERPIPPGLERAASFYRGPYLAGRRSTVRGARRISGRGSIAWSSASCSSPTTGSDSCMVSRSTRARSDQDDEVSFHVVIGPDHNYDAWLQRLGEYVVRFTPR